MVKDLIVEAKGKIDELATDAEDFVVHELQAARAALDAALGHVESAEQKAFEGAGDTAAAPAAEAAPAEPATSETPPPA